MSAAKWAIAGATVAACWLAAGCGSMQRLDVYGEEPLTVRPITWLAVGRMPDSDKEVRIYKFVPDAHCTLKNDKGVWKAEPAEPVTVERSGQPLVLECSAQNYEDLRMEYACIQQGDVPLESVEETVAGVLGGIALVAGLAALPQPLNQMAAAAIDASRSHEPPAKRSRLAPCTYARNKREIWPALTPR